MADDHRPSNPQIQPLSAQFLYTNDDFAKQLAQAELAEYVAAR